MLKNLFQVSQSKKSGVATLSYSPKKRSFIFVFLALFQTPNFRISVTQDASTVEICGALKNIVACGAGFADGLGLGDNTKAAIIRLGTGILRNGGFDGTQH